MRFRYYSPLADAIGRRLWPLECSGGSESSSLTVIEPASSTIDTRKSDSKRFGRDIIAFMHFNSRFRGSKQTRSTSFQCVCSMNCTTSGQRLSTSSADHFLHSSVAICQDKSKNKSKKERNRQPVCLCITTVPFSVASEIKYVDSDV